MAEWRFDSKPQAAISWFLMSKPSFRFKCIAGIVVVAVAVLFVWPGEEKSSSPSQMIALDKTPLIKRLMDKPGKLGAAEAPLRLDPYDRSLLRIKRRSHRDTPGTSQFTFLVPPSLVYHFSLHQEEGADDPSTSAVSLRLLLPDFLRRTEDNHDQFEADVGDFLEITVAYNQDLGLPDSWHRQFIGCSETSKRIRSEYPGLNMADNRGATIFIGCEPLDELPNKVPSLLWCLKDTWTKKLKSCDFQFVVPWRFFAKTTDESDTHLGSRSGEGVVVRTRYPATYLPQWRQLRDVSFCLVEAIVPELNHIDMPSRKFRLCERIKQSLVSGKTKLLSNSENGS